MNLNADMGLRVAIDTGAMDWQASPSPTVWRKRLHLDGGAETGRVTSIVRYDADSSFPAHDHPDGEEIFVLDGVFSDETGDYPAGSYMLNPEGFRHAPFSKSGCTIFVKLRQYAGGGRVQIRRNRAELEWQERRSGGIAEMPLYSQDGYPGRTCLLRFDAGAGAPAHGHPFGEEILVLEGSLEDEFGAYPTGAWIRSPVDSRHAPFSRGGCVLLLKTGSVL